MWTILKQGEKSRPMPAANVIALIEADKLTGTNLAWTTRKTDWVPLHDCPAFQSYFSTVKMTIIPTAVSPKLDQKPVALPPPAIDEPVRPNIEKLKKPKPPSQPQPTNALQGSVPFVKVALAFSFIGFIFFWLLYEPDHLGPWSRKTIASIGFSVLLLLFSFYIMTFHLLVAILRIETALKIKKTKGV